MTIDKNEFDDLPEEWGWDLPEDEQKDMDLLNEVAEGKISYNDAYPEQTTK